MIFEDKPITLKDGRTAILKSPCVEDAEKLLNYIKTSCGETEYLARYPEEWNTTVEQEEAWVNRLRSSPDTLGITCYVDGEVAGNCEISFRGGMKTSHRATIAIAIQRVKEASQSLPPQAANKVKIIFRRGVYLAENTSQAASVDFVPLRGTKYARSRL